MNKISRSLIVIVAVLLLVPAAAFAGGNGTQVYRFADVPFDYFQCFLEEDWFQGPAMTFGEEVCVQYDALWSETVRVSKNGDVAWTVSLHGTATITAVDDGEVLFVGQLKMDEVARDLGGDANCQRFGPAWDPIQGSAMAEGCPESWETTLDFLEHHWKIQGASVFYYDVTIHGAGNLCISSKQDGKLESCYQ